MSGSHLWGGRFAGEPAPDMLRLTSSIDVDLRLLPHDVAATRAHARSLARAGLLDPHEVEGVDAAGRRLLERWERGELEPDPRDEDVHSLVERVLTDELGETGRRIHAGRSRNDLVATDLRLWCRDAAGDLAHRVGLLVAVLADRADDHLGTVMPGYTHLQRAQPVSLAFHLLAHGFSLGRDIDRLGRAATAADVSALGAGAIAGTTLPLDPAGAARELDFSAVFDNAMDATSDRDFCCDLLYACAVCGVHLSRLAEDLVLWSSSEFGFLRLPDEWSTGSSMMPQKRNPDLAELVRGRAAAGIADLMRLLVLLKGLPLAYGRDLQEDKEAVFAAVDRLRGCLDGLTALIEAAVFDCARMAAAAGAAGTWATDVAEILVARGVSFREAHEAAARLVALLEGRGTALADATQEDLETAHPALRPDDVDLAEPRRSLEARASHGGTAPERVRQQLKRLRDLGPGP